MRAGRQDIGSPRFHRLAGSHRASARDSRRNTLRHKLRQNEQLFWLDRLGWRTFRDWRGLNRRTQGRLAFHQEIQCVVVLLLGVGLTMSYGTEFVTLQLAKDAEFFAAVEALHAISVIGGMGEMEEAGKALWEGYEYRRRKAMALRVGGFPDGARIPSRKEGNVTVLTRQ